MKEIINRVIPKLKAIDNSPFDVSNTIPVVIVRVRFSILPPTIIIAPTSASNLPKDTSILIVRYLLDSHRTVIIFDSKFE